MKDLVPTGKMADQKTDRGRQRARTGKLNKNKTKKPPVWTDSSAGKNTRYSCRGPRFCSSIRMAAHDHKFQGI